MTANEARQLVKRLYDAYGKPLHEGQARIYIENLLALPYHLAEAAINAAIGSERYFPSLHAVKTYIRQVSAEGAPGAAVYGRSSLRPRTPTEWAKLLASVQQEQKLRKMDEDEYMEYLTRFRERCGDGGGSVD